MPGGSGRKQSSIPLTHKAIEALRAQDRPYRITDARCAGLAVRVATSGLKTWDLAYRIRGTGETRRVSLGRIADVSLEGARERASRLTGAARLGRDLIAEQEAARTAAAARLTIAELIDIYIRKRVVGRLRTSKEIAQRLERALSSMMNLHAADIHRRDLRAILDPVAEDGREREAERRRQTIGAMYRWAVSVDLVETDPTAGLGTYGRGVPRERVLSFDELRDLWAWLSMGDFLPDPAEVLRVQIATGARCGEISGMHVDEIDVRNWVWTLPSARSKNRRPRSTPLVGLAREIVEGRLANARRGRLFANEVGKPLGSVHIGHWLLARRLKGYWPFSQLNGQLSLPQGDASLPLAAPLR